MGSRGAPDRHGAAHEPGAGRIAASQKILARHFPGRLATGNRLIGEVEYARVPVDTRRRQT